MALDLTISDTARRASKMSLREVEAVVSAINDLSVYTLGDIVELGTYRGGTTEIIALNMKVDRTLWTIDLFECEEKRPEIDLCQGTTIEPHRLYHDALKQCSNTFVIIGDSREVGRRWQGKVAFLIIDAGHHYEEVKADFEAWSPNIVEGGILLLHDAVQFSGYGLQGNVLTGIHDVMQFNNELMESADWHHLQTVDTTTFCRKNPYFGYG